MAVTKKPLSISILLLSISTVLSQENLTSTTISSTQPTTATEPPLIDPNLKELLSLYITPSGPGVSEACSNASKIYLDTLNDVSFIHFSM